VTVPDWIVPISDVGWVVYLTVYDPVALAKRPVPPVIVMTFVPLAAVVAMSFTPTPFRFPDS
jgi:hypothetical protein